MLSVLASCGTSWAIWTGGVLLLLLVFVTPRCPGDWWIIERRRVIVSGSDHCDCDGSCAFPGGVPKATLVDCAWLVDHHLVLFVRHPVAG